MKTFEEALEQIKDEKGIDKIKELYDKHKAIIEQACNNDQVIDSLVSSMYKITGAIICNNTKDFYLQLFWLFSLGLTIGIEMEKQEL